MFTSTRTILRQFSTSPSFQKVLNAFKASKIELTSNSQKLEYYAYFKVATNETIGDQPSQFSFIKRAKWDAWNKCANEMNQQQAEDAYTALAAQVMNITPDELLNMNVPDAIVESASSSTSTSTTASTSTFTSASASVSLSSQFQHRDIREICGITQPTETSILETRATSYSCLSVELEHDTGVAIVNLSRPSKMNAMSIPLWEELLDVFQICSQDPFVKCVVMGADGEHFCSGMDLGVFATMSEIHEEETCVARKREQLNNLIQYFQDGCSAPENCTVPVLCAIHGNAVGGAIDLLTSCDMRYCVNDSMFCVKEIDLGIVADVGTTQRLPKLVGDQRARELTYTARPISGIEAEKIGLVLDSFNTKEEMMTHVLDVARTIASKSPLTIRGIKQVSLYNRDHPNVQDGLEHVKMWNTSYLFSDDLTEAATAMMSKREAVFTKS